MSLSVYTGLSQKVVIYLTVLLIDVNFTIDMSKTKKFTLKKYYELFCQNKYFLLGIFLPMETLKKK